MAYFDEDIFGGGNPIEVVVRWHEKAVAEFDKHSSKSYHQIAELVKDKELPCYFFKVNETEQRIIIPFINEEFQFEIYVEWDEKSFSHKIKVKTNKKTRVVSPINIPHEVEYFIEEVCRFVFIDINGSHFPIREQLDLFERVAKLDILPKIKLDNDLEIWSKYTEAQKIIIDRNAKPIPIKRYFPLIEEKDTEGNVTKCKFKVELHQPNAKETYQQVEKELSSELQIYEKFTDSGIIELTLNNIFTGLDNVIEKKFSDVIERDKSIGCILKLVNVPSNMTLDIELEKHIPLKSFEINKNKKTISIYYSKTHIRELAEYILNNFEFNLIGITTRIIAIDYNDEIKTEYRFIPLPGNPTIENVEALKSNFLDKLKSYKETLLKSSKYRKIINLNVGEYYSYSNFTLVDFWESLKRDVYKLPFTLEINPIKNTLSFDFISQEDFNAKLNRLLAIKKFEFIKNPLDQDFKFKVKTTLVKHKTEKQLLKERLETLNGTEFQIELPSQKEGQENRKKEYVPIGNLAFRESNDSTLVFNFPIKYSTDKANYKKLKAILDEKHLVETVSPNLIGDISKISWLNTAMEKIANPGDGPNSKPVNPNLGQFLFDSSKAEPVFKDLSIDGEEWQRVKRNEMLTLNDSQREAVLSALHARDLCLIQGPPGTGKTTVIAEMIWQIISQEQNQKILLTSETNLAVDNAIEKLINKKHTLVKPIRFGRDEKLEEEGRKYSYNKIMLWSDDTFKPEVFIEVAPEENLEEDKTKDNINNNAVQIWMNRIAEKLTINSNDKYANVLKEWQINLSNPDAKTKVVFRDKYLKYVNVIGSTCSSAGSQSFYTSYEKIFKLENKGLKQKVNINFDVVIMDEASKATPPEMLLPLCFGRKSIIIGDHKQLPPMLNEKEFKEVLQEIKDPKAIALSDEINRDFVETSQFERLILNPKVPNTIIGRLNIQYRMHPKINNVIKQFYTDESDKGLYPAQEIIDNADKTDLKNQFSRYHGFEHENFINPNIHTIWVNVNEPEEMMGTSRINNSEVEAVKNVLTYIKNSSNFEQFTNHWEGIKDRDKRMQEQEIGIISFYGQQVRKLQDVKRFAQNELKIPIRLNTVDKFQGMERNIIIVSTVRSSKLLKDGKIEANNDIGFAKAPERLNVALSRARRLLIIVGNLNFFENYKDKTGNSIYKNAIDIIKQEGLIIENHKSLNLYK